MLRYMFVEMSIMLAIPHADTIYFVLDSLTGGVHNVWIAGAR